VPGSRRLSTKSTYPHEEVGLVTKLNPRWILAVRALTRFPCSLSFTYFRNRVFVRTTCINRIGPKTTVVSTFSGPAPGWTRLPSVMRSSLTRPSIGDLTCVNSRFSAAAFFAATAEAVAAGSALVVAAFWSNSLAEMVFLARNSFARSNSIWAVSPAPACARPRRRRDRNRLIRARINHVKQIILFDYCASLKPDLSNITGHARPISTDSTASRRPVNSSIRLTSFSTAETTLTVTEPAAARIFFCSWLSSTRSTTVPRQ